MASSSAEGPARTRREWGQEEAGPSSTRIMPRGGGIAAVTGASRGIGRATALALAQHGYRVFALARGEVELRQLAAESPSIVPVVMDIADDASRQAAVQRILAETGGYGLDVLVNNAGYGQLGPVEEVPVEALRRQFEVNLFGLLAFTQPFLPGMRDRHRGRVVNVSSAAGRIVTPFMGVYSASKFALEAASDALRRELAPFGVTVILVEPGPIQTHFNEVTGEREVRTAASPYARLQRRFSRPRGGVKGIFTRSAQDVARLIVQAVESPHPRARYTITLPARVAELARFVPDSWIDAAFRLSLGRP